MSFVSYLSVKGMIIFLECKHVLISRKKLHSDNEGMFVHLLRVLLIKGLAENTMPGLEGEMSNKNVRLE